jgi:uncharacterized lipoprotein YddW (UPF0748 family)
MWGKRLILGTVLMFVASGAALGSRANAISKQRGLQGRVIWFDADANLWELSTRKGVAETVAKCKAVNINTIIVDVKPLSGLVLYKSRYAPRLTEFGGRVYPRNYDLLRTVIDEGHKAGIAVHASIDVFSEGSQKLNAGPAFEHPEWQCVQYDLDRTLTTPDKVFHLDCSDKACSSENVYLYGPDPDAIVPLPESTSYVRVGPDGIPVQYGVATGCPRLSPPEGGYIVAATGEGGEWLKRAYDEKARFQLDGRKRMRRVGEDQAIHNAVFVNPLNPEVRAYELNVIREICERYQIDGIVFDRLRYPNIYSDFSDLTKREFEKFIGRKVGHWPEDVYVRDAVPGSEVKRGPLFKDWIKFRAQVMRDFLAEARGVVRSVKPRAMVAIYVGSWYPLYYDVGVNWGSPDNRSDYDWWPDGYEKTGYADLVDYMCTGCYYTYPTREEARSHGEEEWKSVEAAAEESINAVKDATFVYGSLYLFQYHGQPDKFRRAVRQCLDKTQGCMIFDLVYVRNYDWWGILKEEFSTPKKAPHDVIGLR